MYTTPIRNAVNFDFGGVYAVPARNAINPDFGVTSGGGSPPAAVRRRMGIILS